MEFNDFKRFHSENLYDSKKRINNRTCSLCKLRIADCKSHTLPQFILKNISNNGKIMQSGTINKDYINIFELNKGISNSGTMKIICKQCDNERFKDYESIEALIDLSNKLKDRKKELDDLSNRKLLLIYLKSALRKKYDFLVKGIYDDRKYNETLNNVFYQINVNQVNQCDLKEIEEDIEVCLDALKDNKKEICIVDAIVLPYVTSICMQELLFVEKDLNDNIIVNKTKLDEKINYLCFSILPLNESTLIVIFGLKPFMKTYIDFSEEFRKMRNRDKLRFIVSYIFLSSDNVFYNEQLHELFMKDKLFTKFANTHNNTGRIIIENNREAYTSVINDVSGFRNVTNFLGKEYSMDKISKTRKK